MSILSEIVAEGNVQSIVAKLKEKLEENKDNPEVTRVLREIGRWSLTQFEWTSPDWAADYEELFKED